MGERTRDQARPRLAAIPERALSTSGSQAAVARPGLGLHLRRRRARGLAAQTERCPRPAHVPRRHAPASARACGCQVRVALAAGTEHGTRAPQASGTPQRSARTRFAAIATPTNAGADPASAAGMTGTALPRPGRGCAIAILGKRTARRAARVRDAAEGRSPVLPSGWRQNRNAPAQALSSETSPCPSPAAMGLPP
jgi:hypothetical protein